MLTCTSTMEMNTTGTYELLRQQCRVKSLLCWTVSLWYHSLEDEEWCCTYSSSPAASEEICVCVCVCITFLTEDTLMRCSWNFTPCTAREARAKSRLLQCHWLIHSQRVIHLPHTQLQSFRDWRETQTHLTAMTPTVILPVITWPVSVMKKRRCEIEYIFRYSPHCFSILIFYVF